MNYCSILKNGHSISGILASMLEKTEKFTLLFGVMFWLCSGFMFLAILLWKAPKITGLPSKVENQFWNTPCQVLNTESVLDRTI